MEINQILKYKYEKSLIRIQIDCFDHENIDEFMLLMNFIETIAIDKRVFIDSCAGNISESFEEASIIASATNLHNTAHCTLFLKYMRAKSVRQIIFHSRYSNFYIFSDNVSWENFLNTHPRNERILFQKGLLEANITVGEMESVKIVIKNVYAENVELFLQDMNCAGYKLKKTRVLV